MAPAGAIDIGGNDLSLGGPLGNGHYTPGRWSNVVAGGVALIPAGASIFLDVPGTYVFTLANGLTANVGSRVILGIGVDPCSVWWRVPTQATLNGISFAGTVVSNALIALGVGATVTGRALTTAPGSVTLAGNNTIGGCSAAPPPPLPPTVAKAFNPVSITAGGVSRLTITLSNPAALASTLNGIAFTDTLPVGVLVAAVPNLITTCAGWSIVGSTVTLAVGSTIPAAGGSCTAAVNVTAAAAGVYQNTTGALQTTTGNAAPATAPLTVTALPTVAKAFNPASITVAGVSRLTITLSNPNAAAIALTAAFTDTLPAGVLVAAVPNLITTCGGAVAAPSGGSTVTLAAGSTIPSGACTIAVDVTGATAGSFVNTIPAGALQTTTGNNLNPASATLGVACPVITLAPPTLPAGAVRVAYSQTITGSGGTAPYTFTVTSGALPAGLTLTPAGVLAGTPTDPGSTSVTIRGTDANGCFASVAYTIGIAAAPPTPVPTLPQALVVLLALGLTGVGYFRLRRRARAE